MREILFRGKRVDNRRWTYGSYVKATHHWHKNGVHKDWIVETAFANGGWFNVSGRHAVDPETVGQYTGLTDKNGKKIFEGDIIEFTDNVYKRTDTGICVFKDGSFQIKWNYYKSHIAYHRIGQVNVERDMGASYTICYEYNVVGNIHDNPDLIGGEKKWIAQN